MKKVKFSLVFSILLSAISLNAQPVDTAKIHRYQDSVAKYKDIFTYYDNYAPQANRVMDFYMDMELKYLGKIDSISNAIKRQKDKIDRITRKKYLEAKYNIKLN